MGRNRDVTWCQNDYHISRSTVKDLNHPTMSLFLSLMNFSGSVSFPSACSCTDVSYSRNRQYSYVHFRSEFAKDSASAADFSAAGAVSTGRKASRIGTNRSRGRSDCTTSNVSHFWKIRRWGVFHRKYPLCGKLFQLALLLLSLTMATREMMIKFCGGKVPSLLKIRKKVLISQIR